jgi:imidazolonepropionase-like amidohydrolase
MTSLMKYMCCAYVCLVTFAGLAIAQNQPPLVLTGAKVYPSPTEKAVENAVVVIEDGKITRVEAAPGKGSDAPKSARVIDCKGKIIVAGFWNSHVHFETGWENASGQSAEKLEAHMQEMLTRWGFTTVWDLGSDPMNTIALKRRIEAGEVGGPKILMAGDVFPLGGHPVYLPPELELPEAGNAAESSLMARGYLSMGLDGIKLFTGAFMGDKPPVNMPTPVVKAAVDVAHAQDKPVFAHPQNYAGVDNALAGGVDVLAHTIPTAGHFSEEELARMKQQHTALIPTLTLWTTVVPDIAVQNQLVAAGVNELAQYFQKAGTILFGTDVGFIPVYDTTKEYEFMGRAMSWQEILASLTTNPSAYFKAAGKGKVEKGMDADLVVLDADPADDVRNLAKVAYTIREGKIIYQEK